MGVGAAMAAQWVSSLIEHNRTKQETRIRPNLEEIIRECDAQERREEAGLISVASLISPSDARNTQLVAVARPSRQETTWIMCEHGEAVLVSGEEQALEDLTKEDPMIRCHNPKCIAEAERYWRGQQAAAEYSRNCDGQFNSQKVSQGAPRPYPIKRISLKGKTWFAWTPTANRHSTAGGYKWSPLQEPVQRMLVEEIDRLKRLRLAEDGTHREIRCAPLYPSLATLWKDDDQVGFSANEYEARNDHKEGAELWKRLGDLQKDLVTKCVSCGGARRADGKRTCQCSDTPGLQAELASSTGKRRKTKKNKNPLK